MKRLSVLIKPASSLCNMNCRYCFYADISSARKVPSYGIMSDGVTEKILDNIFKDIDDGGAVTFAFQGGEPGLAGLPWFRRFVTKAAQKRRNIALQYAFQTNGLLLDDTWCEFLYENHFLVGLSLDCGKRFHDRNRFSASGEGTWEKVMRARELLDKHRVEYNILSVLTGDLAKEPEKAWNFIVNHNIRYIQFIPCLEPRDDGAFDRENNLHPRNALHPAQFAVFYSRLLPRWIRELRNGNYISVKFFDDTVNLFCKGTPTACGIDGQCHNQYVIEADGSVFPCDFYAIDNYKIGNLTESTPRELFNTEKAREFILEKPTPAAVCQTCGFFTACQGGCKRMRDVMYAEAGGTVCGFRLFLEKCLEPLTEAVRRVFTLFFQQHRIV